MTDNTPLNADDELRRKISKMCEGIAVGYHGEDGIDYIMQLILADRKKHELQARLSSERDTLNTLTKAWNGTYDDANDTLQLLIDNSRLGIKNLEQELENYE